MKKLVFALSVLGLAAVPALAAPTVDLSMADADGDGQVVMQEAIAVGLTEEQFATADADHSGGLSQEECNAIS